MKTLKILGLVSIALVVLCAAIPTSYAIGPKAVEVGPAVVINQLDDNYFSSIGEPANEDVIDENVEEPANETQVVEEQQNEPSIETVMANMTDEHKELLIRSVISEKDEKRLAQTVYGEDRQNNLMRRSAVIWCVFNRIDSPSFGDSVPSVVTHGAFHGYFAGQRHPQWAHDLVRDVALRWALEKLGYKDVGRTLPSEYCFFAGKGGVNRFRTGTGGGYWGWTLPDPYQGAYSFEELEEIEVSEDTDIIE